MLRHAAAGLCLVVLLVPVAHAKNIWRLTDINEGAGGSYPSYLTLYDGDLYFRANDKPGKADIELWRYDPDTGAATQAADIRPGDEGSGIADLVVYGGDLYFAASAGSGMQLWQFDGTTASPVTTFSVSDGLPQEMTAYGSFLIYRQSHFGAATDLYRYDGSAQAPIDAAGGGNVLLPQFFTEYDGYLYFSAGSGTGGAELWRTNGTAATQVTTILSGNGGDPRNLCVYDGDLYFSANDGAHGNELWKWDGAAASLVEDLVPGGQYDSGNPSGMTVYDGKLYFSAWDADHGCELWAYDAATEDAERVAEINPTPNPGGGDDWMMDSNPMDFIVYEGVLYFTATDGSEADDHGREIWSWDGMQAELEFDLYTGQYGSDPSELLLVGDSVYLEADDGIHGSELWRMTFPEPATLALLASGAAALAIRRRRRR